MDLMDVIRKAAAGEVLDERERKLLAGFRPGDETLTQRNRELESRVKELEKSALTEPEQLKQELETLRSTLDAAGAERDAAKQELARINFRRRVDRIAADHNFLDSDYLEYLCSRNAVDPESPEVVDSFLRELRESSPRFFKLDLTPGAPELPPAPAKDVSGKGDVMSLLAEVPALND